MARDDKAGDDRTGMRQGLANYGDAGFSLFLRKAMIKGMGYSDDALERPIVGITDTFSGYNACHRTVPDLIHAIERGVLLAGGLPVRFPTVSDRKSVVSGKSVSVRVDLGGRPIIKKKHQKNNNPH